MTLEECMGNGVSLETKVEYMLDRMAILECVNRYARGIDRHDVEIMRSVYHEDGIDEHGMVVQSMATFPDWANRTHEALTRAHTHNLTTHTCDIEGDVAHAETYVLAVTERPDGKNIKIGGGRYIDRLEKRDGRWAIALRRTVVEWTLSGDASVFHSEDYRSRGYAQGSWSREDISYQRPLGLEPEGEERLADTLRRSEAPLFKQGN